MIDSQTYKKNIVYDIELKLKAIGGKPRNTTGLVDTRLFSGENKLRAIMDTQTCLWYLKYDDGSVPPVLRQRFTGLDKLIKFARDYFIKRNIEIVEIID